MSGLYWLYRIVWIVLAGSHQYRSLGSLGETCFYALAGLLLSGWYGWTGWYIGRTGVGWRDRRKQAPERERHHWILRGGWRWEAVDGTNCVGAGAERAQSICVRSAK